MSNEGASPLTLPLAAQPIGIDYTAAYEQGAGIGRLVRDLVAALAKLDRQTPYKLFVSGATATRLSAPPGTNFSWKATRVTPLWFARVWHRAQLPLVVESFTGRVSLFHATDFTLPPTLPATKTILTVHDLSFVRTPETAPPVLKTYLDQVVPRSVRRADHVIADSQATKDDLIELYGTAPEKISVLLSGVRPEFHPISDADSLRQVREKYHIPVQVPYIFSIGTIQPRKNYGRLVEALARLGKAFEDVHVVIAGGKGWLQDSLFETIKRLNLQARVHLIGFVDDQDVPALYSGALVTYYVSLYEGFGFPVLESMACGTPALTSTVSSLPEVAGDAALMVNPYEPDAITAALHQLLHDGALRERLKAAGFAQAARFTWEKSAQRLVSIYRQVLETA